MRPSGPQDALFGCSNSLHIHELFDFDLDAARSGRIKRTVVVKMGYIHSGVFVVPTGANERRDAARRNLEALLADLLADYWNQFRLLRSRQAGRLTGPQRKDDRYSANKKLSEPRSVEAIRRLWPSETAIFDAIRPLQAAIDAVAAEIASL